MSARWFGPALVFVSRLAFASVSGWDGSDSFAGTTLNSCKWELANFSGTASVDNATGDSILRTE